MRKDSRSASDVFTHRNDASVTGRHAIHPQPCCYQHEHIQRRLHARRRGEGHGVGMRTCVGEGVRRGRAEWKATKGTVN